MENDLLADRNHRLFDPNLPPAYIEAIPTVIGVVDIFDLAVTKFDFANKWITALLAQREIKFTFQASAESARKIEHLYFSACNRERVKGYKNLGFGYPLLTKKDSQANTGLLSLPIFIWEIQLEPDSIKENHWSLSIPNPEAVRLNPILKNFEPEISNLTVQFEKKLSLKGFNQKESIEFCALIAELLVLQNDRPTYNIEQFPDLVDLSTLSELGSISWAGILTAFPPILDYAYSESSLSKEFWNQTITQETPLQFSYLAADHQQKAAHIAASKNKFILIDGPTGSGKNHTICNFIIGNLLNKQHTFLVGHSVAELEKIYEKLANEGFGALAFLFRNLTLDKDTIVDKLKIEVDKTLKSRRPKNNNFNLAYQRFAKFRWQLEKEAEAYASNVFDINNWTETVGLFLKNSRSEGKELLDTQLQVNDFVFDFFEYDQLLEKVLATHKIFRESYSFFHPLDELSINCFSDQPANLVRQQLEAKLTKFLKQTRSVQREFLHKLDLYKNALETHYEQHYLSLKSQLEKTKDIIDQMQLELGKDYDQTSVSNLKFFKSFSDKSKTALNLKSKILSEFGQLKILYIQQQIFDFEFLESTATGDLVVINQQLTDFEKELVDWRVKSHGEIQDNVKRLNSKTALAGIAYSEEITVLESAVENLVNSINESHLFRKKFNNNGMTLQLKQQLLEEIVEKLNKTLFFARDFEEIYDWRKLVETFTINEKKVVDALIKIRPANWTAAFDAWYFHNLLTKESRQSINFQPLLNSFLVQFETVKEKIPDFITSLWLKVRKNTISATKKEKRGTYSSFLKKSKDPEKFTKWFQRHLNRITNFYPVVLLTTEMATELLDDSVKMKFDSIIVQASDNLTAQQGGSLLNFANKVQVFGDGKSINANDPNSFWQIAKSLAGKHIIFKNQHRNKAIPLLEFSNAAFDQSLKVSSNGQSDSSILQTYALNGDYDEHLKTNEKECRYMLSLLTTIEDNPQHTYPKIGFVCATVEQRNLFASYLLKIKQTRSNGMEKIQHLERNGMGVYHLEEIMGQQFDVLIFSLTYGIVNAAGELTKDLNYLKTDKGIQLIQSLLNGVGQTLHICHSLPLKFIKISQIDQEQRGLYILSNLLQFGIELTNNNPSRMKDIISRLYSKTQSPKVNEKGVFLGQVAHYLSAYFEPDRILENHQIGHEIFPLIIKGKKEKQGNYIIQADSFFNNVDVFSYLWQEHSNRALTTEGFNFINIWSRDWWRNPEGEARKLASQIIKEDGRF